MKTNNCLGHKKEVRGGRAARKRDGIGKTKHCTLNETRECSSHWKFLEPVLCSRPGKVRQKKKTEPWRGGDEYVKWRRRRVEEPQLRGSKILTLSDCSGFS